MNVECSIICSLPHTDLWHAEGKIAFPCNLQFNPLALELSAQFALHWTLDLNGNPLLCMFVADDLVLLDFSVSRCSLTKAIFLCQKVI
jgi:hypothetical protein